MVFWLDKMPELFDLRHTRDLPTQKPPYTKKIQCNLKRKGKNAETTKETKTTRNVLF